MIHHLCFFAVLTLFDTMWAIRTGTCVAIQLWRYLHHTDVSLMIVKSILNYWKEYSHYFLIASVMLRFLLSRKFLFLRRRRFAIDIKKWDGFVVTGVCRPMCKQPCGWSTPGVLHNHTKLSTLISVSSLLSNPKTLLSPRAWLTETERGRLRLNNPVCKTSNKNPLSGCLYDFSRTGCPFKFYW